jgi:hypothetical protein
MNRLYTLLTVMVVMVGAPFFFAAQEALAEVLTGTGGNDKLVGTNRHDRLEGRGGDDRLKGRGGKDKIIPGTGDDEVYAGAGDDRIYARQKRRGLHRLWGRLRPGRDHTPRRPDQGKLRESPRPSPG